MLRTSACTCLLLVVLGESGEAIVQSGDERELLRLEGVWNRAHIAGDARALDALWADDLVVSVPSMRVLDKSDSLGMFEKARMKFDKYESSDVRVRVYGDAAVVTGRILRSRAMQGKTANDDWRFTKTYIRRDGTWRVVAFHASPTQ